MLARAHLLPAFARLGPYDPALFDRAVARGDLIEYWAHVASFIPGDLFPAFNFRKADYVDSDKWDIAGQPAATSPVTERVRDLLAEHGPSTARELHVHFAEEFPRSDESWGWNWSVAKHVCEYLYRTGEVGVSGRTPSFERRYDLIERHPITRRFPPDATKAPSRDEAHRILVERAARAHGIGSIGCFAHYFYLYVAETKRAVLSLVSDGVLEPVRVEGWPGTLYLHTEAPIPRKVNARALLAPFDPLVWDRRRLAALFGMHYRISIYTPAHERTHGYYVLPFLLGEDIVARVDLKADRQAGVLRVQHLTMESGVDPDRVAGPLAAELLGMMGWLGLAEIEVMPGEHAELLKGAVGGSSFSASG